MKECSYCGKEFSDSVTVCDVDGQPLAAHTHTKQKSREYHYPRVLGPAGPWLIFSGVPLSFVALLMVFVVQSDGRVFHVSQRYMPYALLASVSVVMIVFRELFHRLPKRLIIPLGIIGWAIVVIFVACYAQSVLNSK